MVVRGREGAQSKLQLAYGSGGMNGLCGVGWSLDIGYIERDTRFGPPIAWSGSNAQTQYDDTKGFVFNMNGTSGRLILTPRTDEYRLEIQTARLVFNLDRTNNKWTVTDAGGNKFYFGQADSSRMKNSRWSPAVGNPQTFRWALDQITDINGNNTIVSWQADGGTLYPSS